MNAYFEIDSIKINGRVVLEKKTYKITFLYGRIPVNLLNVPKRNLYSFLSIILGRIVDVVEKVLPYLKTSKDNFIIILAHTLEDNLRNSIAECIETEEYLICRKSLDRKIEIDFFARLRYLR